MQIDYSGTRKIGIAGQKSDSGISEVLSKCNKASGEIPYATLVAWDGNDGCKLPTSKDDITKNALGVTLLSWPSKLYKAGSTINVLREGRVLVEAQTDIDGPGSEVFVRFEAGPDAKQLGSFGAVQEPSTAKLPRTCFLQSAKKGELVELELNLKGGCK